jgi:hypothetical protein
VYCHLLEVETEDVGASLRVWRRDVEDAVEATWAHEGGVLWEEEAEKLKERMEEMERKGWGEGCKGREEEGEIRSAPRSSAIRGARTHNHVRSVGSSEHNHAVELLNTVHLGEQAHQDSVAGRSTALLRASSRGEGVDFVL